MVFDEVDDESSLAQVKMKRDLWLQVLIINICCYNNFYQLCDERSSVDSDQFGHFFNYLVQHLEV
jgi:hypothetical protein